MTRGGCTTKDTYIFLAQACNSIVFEALHVLQLPKLTHGAKRCFAMNSKRIETFDKAITFLSRYSLGAVEQLLILSATQLDN
jgi:hypothetical protein